jgi:protein required for attachment to host cells
MKAISTLILIADDASARFCLNEGVGKGLREVAAISATQFPEDSREFADRPVRSSSVAGTTARHGVEPHTELDQQHRTRFAVHILQALDQTWTQVSPDRMILAAPPKMLGVLRAKLRGDPAKALMADLPKHLVNVPVHELSAHFGDLLAV